MPRREQLLHDLAAPNRHAALLLAQVGAMPTELQLVVQVAEYDEAARGLRPIRSYIIRVSGVLEHRIVNLGTTVDTLTFTEDHPLLYEYVDPPAAVFFRGTPADTNAVVLDIAQAHATTLQGWRHFPEYLNVAQPLETLFRAGGGLIGQMPHTLAERMVPVLARHGLEHKVMLGEPPKPPIKGQKPLALLIGESYCLSYLFSVDAMGKG